jgi:hypothetical protein
MLKNDAQKQRSKTMLKNDLKMMLENEGFVSGYRFSDTTSLQNHTPL